MLILIVSDVCLAIVGVEGVSTRYIFRMVVLGTMCVWIPLVTLRGYKVSTGRIVRIQQNNETAYTDQLLLIIAVTRKSIAS